MMTFSSLSARVFGMKQLPLKRSPEYKARVSSYAHDLAKRYRPEVADVFLENVKEAEKLIRDNNHIGTNAPYVLSENNVVLKELYFKAGPVNYCLIYDVMTDFVGLISLWHGVGVRSSDTLTRIWRRSY